MADYYILMIGNNHPLISWLLIVIVLLSPLLFFADFRIGLFIEEGGGGGVFVLVRI